MQWNSLSIIICILTFSHDIKPQEKSRIIFEDNNGLLRYHTDQEQNYIPDFSYAGYRNGEVALPNVPIVHSIGPIEGDNTAHIQFALDSLSELPFDVNGFRGALQLEAGSYEIHGTLVIRASGIVLRGMGDGDDPATNTILLGIGNTPVERDIVQLGNASEAGWDQEVPGSNTIITNSFVPAGSRSLAIANTSLYKEGDNIIIHHPSTLAWLQSIDYGGTDTDDPWVPGEIDLVYNRYITAIDNVENKIVLDVPVYDHFELELSQARIYKLNKENIKRQIGIEHLRIDIQTEGVLTENHAKNTIRLIGVEDCWVSNITALHFSYAAVDTRITSRVTVKNCQGLEPHAEITGGRRYNFAVGQMSNQILFENCHATQGRHSFVSNGTSSVSGIVFYNCTSEQDYASSEGHRRWSQALLFDNITFSKSESNILLGLHNRGRFGTGHGWSSTHSVAWNIQLPLSSVAVIQKPPGRQNYAIGCQSRITNAYTFTHPLGYTELTNQELRIPSLYIKQLQFRLVHGVTPDAPGKLQAELQKDKIQLNWLDIASQETGYCIEISIDGGNSFSEIAQVQSDQTSFVHSDFPTRGELIYRVYAIGKNCPSPYSNEAKIELVTSHSPQLSNEINIFPNPFSEEIYIHTKIPDYRVKILDTNGRVIISRQGVNTLNTSNLTSNLYLIQIQDKQGRSRIIKMLKSESE